MFYFLFQLKRRSRASILHEGLVHSNDLLSNGIQRFSSLISFDSLTLKDSTFVIDKVRKNDVEQRNNAEQQNEEEQRDEEEEEEDETNDESDNDEFEITCTMLKNVGDDLIDFSLVECVCTSNDASRVINLPLRFCQSGLNGRNGSSACSVISVIAGYYFTKFSFKFENLIEDILPLYVGCIEIGNCVHQTSHFLYVHEAIALLPLSMSSSWEENVYLRDLNLHIMRLEKSQFMVVISGCYAVCIVKNDDHVTLFDSHSRNGLGALIAHSSLDDLSPIIDNILVQNPEVPLYYSYIDIFW